MTQLSLFTIQPRVNLYRKMTRPWLN